MKGAALDLNFARRNACLRRAVLFVGWLAFLCAALPASRATTIASAPNVNAPRREFLLEEAWRSTAVDSDAAANAIFFEPSFDDSSWARVSVPHNWDDYGGAHRLIHGNRHGVAWYRRWFDVAPAEQGRRVFLFFEGVSSYATVWVNGHLAGKHAGGRTTFTLDVTQLTHVGQKNLVAVRADHPAGITDLPWVCGGCSTAPGFSEGSQPMGIFRPVHVVTTNAVRVQPFGVHIWNDADASATAATLHIETELNNAASSRALEIVTRAIDRSGAVVGETRSRTDVSPGDSTVKATIKLAKVALWSLTQPALYRIETVVSDGDRVLDQVETSYGIRTIHWPDPSAPESSPFLLNGAPVFINGTCEYEHLLGASHAFGDEQIKARVAQIRSLGFNASRDAHQPHNLRYQEYWDRDGLLWWPQFAAQIWFDTPQFRTNFKTLLREWVRERRNSPSLVLWGLANESKLPADFARECVEIIRDLDPTASSQRLITTCNSGKGTDWNVPQNWSGTYGGKPEAYAEELKSQRLVGEYGAWRSLGLHSEGGYVSKGTRSEDRAAALLETKIRLAESVREIVPGHFHWLFATHDNPGRTIGSEGQQGSDGWPELDRIGPANNKGLFTLWGEPTDLFYLYRANYAPPASDPMVYIVSHTWPDRWKTPGKKSGLVVYSNCDEVELFNDFKTRSLGRKKRGPVGTHFQWDDVEVATNVLYAEGRAGGRVVAHDAIVLKNLPEAEQRGALNGEVENLTAARPGQNYLYRVNCGGLRYVDHNGVEWLADQDYQDGDNWGSLSWAAEFSDVPVRFGSQRESFEPIVGTRDEALFQTYRYGREKLRYRFQVPDGEYALELYFTEPWYGAGGGDCRGWRLFDVAVNGETKLRDLDLYAESGYAHAVRKIVEARAVNGWLEVSFPRVSSYQAVISAIAVSTKNSDARIPAPRPRHREIQKATNVLQAGSEDVAAQSLFAAKARITEGWPAERGVLLAEKENPSLSWPLQVGLGGQHKLELNYASGSGVVKIQVAVEALTGDLVDAKQWILPATHGRWSTFELEGGLSFNAGEYTVKLSRVTPGVLRIDALTVR